MAKYKIGMAAIFHDEHQVVKAAAKVRESGYTRFDAISPFPVHGMEEACGIKRSWIPWVTFFAGSAGCFLAWLMQWWISAVNWPLNIGGKPYHSFPAFIPIMFELTVLIGSLCSVAALFYACGIPKVNPPVIDPALSSHKFAIFIPSDDTGYDEKKVEDLFRQLGAAEIKRTEF
jgi:hypothetical protein